MKKVKFDDVKELYLKFFEKNGIRFTKKNGEALPLDDICHELGKENKWSVDIIALSKHGLVTGYYRGSDKQFTLSGFAVNDLYLKDCKSAMLSNKFIKTEQLEELKTFVKSCQK